jgi:S-adenosylmethionine:tRNA ribosyltransferase-isomerase
MANESGTHEEPILLEDFNFELPDAQIASEPARPRDASRLLVVNRSTGAWIDRTFQSLAEHLEPGDVLVVNDTRVVKARVQGLLERTGRDVEVFFADPIEGNRWGAMLRPGKRIRPGDRIVIDPAEDHPIYIEVGGPLDHGLRELSLSKDSALTVPELLDAYGHIPLPPYIEREDNPSDQTDYQTVYARHDGAIAAPTAGLHFTDGIFASLKDRGIETAQVTLHVGIGTFIPVRTADARKHRLKPERFEISEESAESLNRARADGRRIIAVGTTTTRTLEYAIKKDGRFSAGTGETDLYILPGYRFEAVDGLVTNFHLPGSTLLLLVSAFAQPRSVLAAYRHAIKSGYRFYSYGDASLFI